MPEGRTSGNAILYMEETTTTSNAAETDESGTKPEAALAFTQRTSNVRKIAVSLPVTDESLEDIPFIESYIDTRLSFFIRQREDSELLVGDGTGVEPPRPERLGHQHPGTGTDNNQDAILKAIVQVQVASYFDADAVVLHPNNWQTMRLAKDDVGNYLFGPPNMPGADQVFGYRIVKTTAMTAGTGLAGAFRACAEVFRRTDLACRSAGSTTSS
jgi:HK97 family phage major capsid protein